MKLYLGKRDGTKAIVFVDDTELPLEPSLKLRDHSPTGFEWAYHGSGPTQLALAILLDLTANPDLSLAHYQDFRDDFIATAAFDGFVISELEVGQWLIGKV
jgi:hypothetical protein